MDVPEAPAIVFDRAAPCPDAFKAEALLERTLAHALAPRGSWTVIARFSRTGPSLKVVGVITDEVDSPVAHRVITQPGYECASLARAVGVWAALVLDAEVERATHTPPPPSPPPLPPTLPDAPPPPPEEQPAPDGSLLLVHRKGEQTLELGGSVFLMGGVGAGAMAGPTIFGVVEAGQGWFLRPGVFMGQTLDGVGTSNEVSGSMVEGRFDACGRIAGFYIERHGIQLDVCGGAEGGFTHVNVVSGTRSGSGNLPLLALGPSMSLRGELGNGLAVLVRGIVDYELIQERFFLVAGTWMAPSALLSRGEVGLSWQLR